MYVWVWVDGYVCPHTHTRWTITQPLKTKEIMLFAATWMDLEIVIQSEVSQRNEYHMTALTYGT